MLLRLKLVISVILFLNLASNAQDYISRDTLLSDFKYFIKILEDSHPDPYSAFGGRIYFHQDASKIIQKLQSNDYTKNEFAEILKSFISRIGDGHTNILSGNSIRKEAELRLPIELQTFSDGLFLSSVPVEYKHLLGSRLTEINNVPIDSVLNLTSMNYPTENYYGQCLYFRKLFPRYSFINEIFPGISKDIIIGFLTPDGIKENITLMYKPVEDIVNEKTVEIPQQLKLPGNKYMYYQFIDPGNKTMFFSLKSIMAKEAFASMIKNNMHGDLNLQLSFFYKRYMNIPLPESIDEAIEIIPSLAETFSNMLYEMKENNAKNLIIDLRNNDGGWTSIVLPTLYQLYGDRYLKTKPRIKFIRLISELYLKKIGTNIDEYNNEKGTNYRLGDYNFDLPEVDESKTIEQLRYDLIQSGLCNKKYIENLNGTPVYSPQKVIVLTNDGTFSAAFHYAYYLWKLGAVVVGVPSSQAPNTFIDLMNFELPCTKLKGSVSNSMQIIFSPDDRRARVFYPDYSLMYSDYKKYGFDRDSEVLYILDKLMNMK